MKQYDDNDHDAADDIVRDSAMAHENNDNTTASDERVG